MISHLSITTPQIYQVWLADDAAGAGKISDLNIWYKQLAEIGKHHGYHVNGGKSWLICKSEELAAKAAEEFGNTVNITTEGKRHLGAVLGSANYKDEYCQEKVDNWTKELEVLAEIAETEPQAAYSVYPKGYRSKFTYFLRTIQGFEDYLEPVESVLFDKLVPALFGGEKPDIPNKILTLNPKDGGLGIQNPRWIAQSQYKDSKLKTAIHSETIRQQKHVMLETTPEGKSIAEVQNEVKEARSQWRAQNIEGIEIPEQLRTCIAQAKDEGASSWLNALPLKEQNLHLNKEQFSDALCLRYNQRIKNLPSTCPCGSTFNVEHALNCKKGGFIAQRHDNLRDLFTNLLTKVCKDVQVEPHLLPVTNETFEHRTANTSSEARLDVKANGFWQRNQTAFFDIRVTHVNSSSQAGKSTQTIFKNHENSKKREYLERILNVEHGVFTPLVFGTNGGMGKECQMFLKQLATTLAEKTDQRYSDVITWLRARISTEILKSAVTCIRGSRVPFNRPTSNEASEGFEFLVSEAQIR